MRQVHIRKALKPLCGAPDDEPSSGYLTYPGDPRLRGHDWCTECEERLPLVLLAATDLGDDGPQAPTRAFACDGCGVGAITAFIPQSDSVGSPRWLCDECFQEEAR